MLRAQTYCSELGCPNLVKSGRCAACQAKHRKSLNDTEWQKLYRCARWRRLRLQVIADQPFCEFKDPGCTLVADEVHHVVKRLDNLALFFERSNLKSACRSCHARRTRRGE
jgi:5-methylcytosine-specific restriction enzyme A